MKIKFGICNLASNSCSLIFLIQQRVVIGYLLHAVRVNSYIYVIQSYVPRNFLFLACKYFLIY